MRKLFGKTVVAQNMDQNDNPVTKRLFVAGLHGDVDSAQLAARFQPFGDVIDVALARSALDGSCRGFAHIGIIIAPSKLKKCLTVYSGTKWKGMQLKVEEAKPDFKARIQKEHKAAELAAASTPADAEKKKRRNRKRGVSEAELADDMNLIDDDNVAKRKGWKRGKYGRPVAVIRIVNPATGKRVFVDPQKYRDNLKKLDHTTRNGRETSATEAVSTFIIPKYSGVKTILEEAIPSPQTPTDRDIAEFRDGDKGDSQDIENEQNESVHEDEAEHAVEEGGYEPMEVEHGEDTFERRISQYSTHKDPLDAVLNAERHKSLSILNDLFGNSSGDQSESSTGKEKQNASFGKQKSSFSKRMEARRPNLRQSQTLTDGESPPSTRIYGR
ncbi:hypothetical protein BJ742DRAFT_363148 [Cladochytrium replicatum]|nr:hypothetical protein BJ742DRAFT_363148 [Cladochytrium replicatum]